jgi:transcriptional regulator with XRE-family HTH domain
MDSFGKRLKDLRKRCGYSQYTLADKVGSSRRVIRYYECEATRPPAAILPQLAEALNVSVNVLLGTEEPRDDKRTVDAKFWPKWQELSGEEKKTVSKLVDTLLAAHG